MAQWVKSNWKDPSLNPSQRSEKVGDPASIAPGDPWVKTRIKFTVININLMRLSPQQWLKFGLGAAE